eukprot:TRINITY_DN16519_c0_g2_i1.p1 TRINITY_DN16519_c0_g2~~TRINITY_DN16519_c0_g2_i1.p1  ORF type:complete len:444 (+),score=66.01 TRINITY_DN16519_c0_g2_i1:58-1389(+)
METIDSALQSGGANVLIIGPALCGKSTAIRHVADRINKAVYELTPASIYEQKFANGDRCFLPPDPDVGVMIVKHIDVLLEDKDIWVQFYNLLTSKRKWSVACTARRKQPLPQTILQQFEPVHEMQMPSVEERVQFLNQRSAPSAIIKTLASKLGGVGYKDLESISTIYKSPSQWHLISSSTCSIMSRQYNVSTPQVRWDDIIGHTAAKETIQTALSIHSLPSETLSKFSLSSCTGILLYGLPGNGKTMLAKAIATELQSSFLLVSITSLVKSYVGESEEAVRDLFKAARQNAPCCIFLDEIQAIFGDREDVHGTDHDSRLVSQLLSEMDNLPPGVTVISATNVPSALDSSILSPGRLDMHIHVTPPTLSERTQFLSTFLPLQSSTLGDLTTGYSYADLTAFKNLIHIHEPDCGNDSEVRSILSLTHPSFSKEELAAVERWVAK